MSPLYDTQTRNHPLNVLMFINKPFYEKTVSFNIRPDRSALYIESVGSLFASSTNFIVCIRTEAMTKVLDSQSQTIFIVCIRTEARAKALDSQEASMRAKLFSLYV